MHTFPYGIANLFDRLVSFLFPFPFSSPNEPNISTSSELDFLHLDVLSFQWQGLSNSQNHRAQPYSLLCASDVLLRAINPQQTGGVVTH